MFRMLASLTVALVVSATARAQWIIVETPSPSGPAYYAAPTLGPLFVPIPPAQPASPRGDVVERSYYFPANVPQNQIRSPYQPKSQPKLIIRNYYSYGTAPDSTNSTPSVAPVQRQTNPLELPPPDEALVPVPQKPTPQPVDSSTTRPRVEDNPSDATKADVDASTSDESESAREGETSSSAEQPSAIEAESTSDAAAPDDSAASSDE